MVLPQFVLKFTAICVYINIKQSYNVLEKVFLCIGSLLGFFFFLAQITFHTRFLVEPKYGWKICGCLSPPGDELRGQRRREAWASGSVSFALSLALSRRKWKPHPQVCLLTRCAPAATTTTTGGGRFTLSVWWNTHTQPKESLRCNKSTNFRDWEQLI